MAKNYDIHEDTVPTVGETPTLYAEQRRQGTATSSLRRKQSKTDMMREYCRTHFDEQFIAEMETKNFLIDAPQPSNEDEFVDIDQMFEEAEASGDCTEDEVRLMFAV